MSLLENVGARLAEVVDGLPHAPARRAADLLDQVVARLAVLAEGSEHPSLLAALACFTRARDAANDLSAALHACTDHIHAYQTALGLPTGGTGAPAVDAPSSQPTPVETPRSELATACELLATMPTMDAEAATTGRRPRTRGRWLRNGTAHTWDSGLDGKSGRVRTLLLQLGILNVDTRRDKIVAHAEIRLAALMRLTGGSPRREVLVINNRRVCDKGNTIESLNCQNLLPKILGTGQELVVYTPTHTGGVRKWQFRGGE
ncbi:MAG TPA: DddA-like double-stranded DNA deaminase toxin [Mycobacteriales bacterium]|nr:DddA-like double-stranded DNA deaminase toxin [Mycobacteriales bacterium]